MSEGTNATRGSLLGEGAPFVWPPNIAQFVCQWLFFVVVVPVLADWVLPVPSWLEGFATRFHPTEVTEFALSVGLTLVALSATTLAVMWQLTLQKYSGSFVRYLTSHSEVTNAWLSLAFSALFELILWVWLYDKRSSHPAAVRYFGTTVVGFTVFASSIGWSIWALAKTLQDLSPRNLLRALCDACAEKWTEMALSPQPDQVYDSERLLRRGVEWLEILIPNISKVGMGALRDGDFELLRDVFRALATVYRTGDSPYKVARIHRKIIEHHLDVRRELKDVYWLHGLVTRELRELMVYALSLKDPGFTDRQFLKVIDEWQNLPSRVSYLEVRYWIKFTEEVFIAAQAAKRPVICFEMLQLGLRLFRTVWGRYSTVKVKAERYGPALQDITSLINKMLVYCVSDSDTALVRDALDVLIQTTIVIGQQGGQTEEQDEFVRDLLDSVYLGAVDAGTQAILTKRYDVAGEVVRRIVFFLDASAIPALLEDTEGWEPNPPMTGSSVLPPVTDGGSYHLYQFRKFYAILMAYADFHAKRGMLAYRFQLDENVFPLWFLDGQGQVSTLQEDLTGRADIWDYLFLGSARSSFTRFFQQAQRARKRLDS